MKILYFYEYINTCWYHYIYVYALMNVKSILNLEKLEKLLFEYIDSFKRNNKKKLEIANTEITNDSYQFH